MVINNRTFTEDEFKRLSWNGLNDNSFFRGADGLIYRRVDASVTVGDIEAKINSSMGGTFIGKTNGDKQFDVDYASGTTLTIGNYPDGSTLVIEDISYISVIDNTGAYVQTLSASELTLSMSGSTLTVTGFTNAFNSTDSFIIGTNVAYTPGYNPTTMYLEVDRKNTDTYIAAVEIVSEQDLTGSYADFGGEQDVEEVGEIGIGVTIDVNDSTGSTMQVVGLFETGGTEYDIDGLSVVTLETSDSSKMYTFDTGPFPIVKIQAKAGVVGATAGDLTISVSKVKRSR